MEFFEESLDFLGKHAELIHSFEKWELFQVYLTGGTYLTIVELGNKFYWTFDLADPKDRSDVWRIFEYLGFQDLYLKLNYYIERRRNNPDLIFCDFNSELDDFDPVTLYPEEL